MAYDHVIAGGGIYGAYAAWELARRGAEVALFEADEVGAGASAGPGKRGVRANGRDPRELPLMERAYDRWASLGGELGADIGYERTGGLQLIEREVPEMAPTSTASARAQSTLQNNHGIRTEVLDGAAVRELEPEAGDRVVGAVHAPDDGVADHTATTAALAAAAGAEGAEVIEGTPIEGIVREGGTVSAVRTGDGAEVRVDGAFLLLTNAAAPGFVEAELGVALPTWPFRPQVLVTEPVEPAFPEHLIGHSHRRMALKALPGGRLMISGGWVADWDRETGATEPIPEHVEANVAEAAAVFPRAEGVAVEEVTADHLEPASIDHLPVVDRLPGAGNMIVATGWNGHGFAIAPAVAELLAEWAATGAPPPLLEPFSVRRFGLDSAAWP